MENNTITISDVCKNHGQKQILDHITLTARPGRVTAFLGPNGAGKSSTLRILLGLDHAKSGTAVFGQQTYQQITDPLKRVGVAFDGIGGNPNRTVKTHLKIIAVSNGISTKRIYDVLSLVQLTSKIHAKLGTLSLGEGQRLGIAITLLGDPQFLIFDEPTNGLDPQGIKWFRTFIRIQADCGKTVLLSSHYLSEIEAVADDVIIIKKGKIVLAGELHEIMPNLKSLEDVFFSLTEGESQYEIN
ncbi:ABC transporter ATP-binding protein [Xylocopilactobacillus apis]|uniref:ABC transporter ATP-binding protein n=1 Tax=Xylocopilactobacillus apis TaxID=2932183 RepID=A0AAU9CRN8_9LACO|nr:ATP-binding cassette domain-containing protein [Xylocopilactobacillus apis]BDR56602.1 ABC transporter ATP-binding protein [Xylocopilactobacillus apis]